MTRIYFKPQGCSVRNPRSRNSWKPGERTSMSSTTSMTKKGTISTVLPSEEEADVFAAEGQGISDNNVNMSSSNWRKQLDPVAIDQIADGLEKMVLSWSAGIINTAACGGAADHLQVQAQRSAPCMSTSCSTPVLDSNSPFVSSAVLQVGNCPTTSCISNMQASAGALEDIMRGELIKTCSGSRPSLTANGDGKQFNGTTAADVMQAGGGKQSAEASFWYLTPVPIKSSTLPISPSCGVIDNVDDTSMSCITREGVVGMNTSSKEVGTLAATDLSEDLRLMMQEDVKFSNGRQASQAHLQNGGSYQNSLLQASGPLARIQSMDVDEYIAPADHHIKGQQHTLWSKNSSHDHHVRTAGGWSLINAAAASQYAAGGNTEIYGDPQLISGREQLLAGSNYNKLSPNNILQAAADHLHGTLATNLNRCPFIDQSNIKDESVDVYKKKVEELQIALLECAMEYEVKIVEMKMQMLHIRSEHRHNYINGSVESTGSQFRAEQYHPSKLQELVHYPRPASRSSSCLEEYRTVDDVQGQRMEHLRKQFGKLQREKLALARELHDLKKRERQFDLQRRSLEDALARVNSLQRVLAKREQEIVDCQLREKEVRAQLYEVQLLLHKAQAAQIEPRKLLSLLPTLREWLQTIKKVPCNSTNFIEPRREKLGRVADLRRSPPIPVDSIVCTVTREIQSLQKALSKLASKK